MMRYPTLTGVNSGLEDTRYLAEAFQEGPATAFETYNRMRYRDLQYLGAYAWQLKDNLSGTDKAARIANLMFQIFQSTQCVDCINRTRVVSFCPSTGALATTRQRPYVLFFKKYEGCTKCDHDLKRHSYAFFKKKLA
jgi:hypothetical protein